MKKKMMIAVCACVVVSTMVFAAQPTVSNTSMNGSKSINYKQFKAPLVNTVYTVSQFDNTQFPDAYISSISPRTNMQRSFVAYNTQGYVTVVNHGETTGTLVINGYHIPLQPYLSKGTFTLDISKFVRNGQNALEIKDIPMSGSASMNVYVPYPTLKMGTPQSVGMNPYWIQKANTLIASQVNNGKGLPGAVLLVIKDGVIVDYHSFGYSNEYDIQGNQLPQSQWIPMQNTTLFDMASLTKMFATNISLMHLEYTNQLDMLKPLKTYIPDYQFPTITCNQIAEHTAGYAPEVLFYEQDGGGAGPQFYSQDRSKTLNLLETQVPQVYAPGTQNVYSDTDFMLMGDLIEHISGQTEDKYVMSTFYQPLGLTDIMYNPLQNGVPQKDIAATALKGNMEADNQYANFPNRRTGLVWGTCQDEKAYYSMGGVSGHAGLFGDAYDIGVLEQLVLNGGGYGNQKFFDQSVLDQFTKPTDTDETYGIGWRRAGAQQSQKWMFGPYASSQAFGHTGFTGQMALMDPQYGLAIVLLTNRTQTPQLSKMSFEGDNYSVTSYGDVATDIYKSILFNTVPNGSSNPNPKVNK